MTEKELYEELPQVPGKRSWINKILAGDATLEQATADLNEKQAKTAAKNKAKYERLKAEMDARYGDVRCTICGSFDYKNCGHN